MARLQGFCGQVRKCDVKVSVDLDVDGIEIEIISKFDKMFKTHMEKAVRDVLSEEGVLDAKVVVEDEGALDFAIRARTRTAIRRSRGV
jgi:citrate lyase subunit gamma (acyl carrier protein)